MKNGVTAVKAAVAGFSGALTSVFGILAVPILLMVSCNVIDYATGLMAAKYRNESVNSYKGLRGITKKVCMWLLVVVGFIIDQLLAYAANVVGIPNPFTYLVACCRGIMDYLQRDYQHFREHSGHWCWDASIFNAIGKKHQGAGGIPCRGGYPGR